MPEFVLSVDGSYAIRFEALTLEDAALLAQVSDEWQWPTQAILYEVGDPDSQMDLTVGIVELPEVTVMPDAVTEAA